MHVSFIKPPHHANINRKNVYEYFGQASTMATAAARAQAGIVRREVLDCRDDLSRAVADGVEEPVGKAVRENFEAMLVPRIQVRYW